MGFRIPFSISRDLEISKRRSKAFIKYTRSKKSRLDEYLKDTGEDLNRRQYLSITYRNFVLNLLVFSVIFTSILGIFKANLFVLYGLTAAFLISGFILVIQINYPKIFSTNKAREVEKNLISVLQDMMVQLNSGVPMFNMLLNIADSDYGEISEEFKKITKEINAGIPQIEAIENHGKITNSSYFKRILWQISNGMRSGSNMSSIIKEGIKNLSEEQAIQIQSYGGRLNPLVMFYMLMAVILPALGITFFIIISSMLNLPENVIKLVFFGIFGAIVFIQIMFIGLLKSRRPSLL